MKYGGRTHLAMHYTPDFFFNRTWQEYRYKQSSWLVWRQFYHAVVMPRESSWLFWVVLAMFVVVAVVVALVVMVVAVEEYWCCYWCCFNFCWFSSSFPSLCNQWLAVPSELSVQRYFPVPSELCFERYFMWSDVPSEHNVQWYFTWLDVPAETNVKRHTPYGQMSRYNSVSIF